MSYSKEDLLTIAQKYYDSSNSVPPSVEPSPEALSRHSLWEQWISDMSSWYALRDTLSSALPGYITGETYSSSDGGPRCMVYPPEESGAPTSNWIVVGCVSLLAPVYFVYGVEQDNIGGRLRNSKASFEPPPTDMIVPARLVARTIETVLGYSPLPQEIAATPVPLFIEALEPPETTLFHVLFTNEPSNIP
jgi:hypothetical protein